MKRTLKLYECRECGVVGTDKVACPNCGNSESTSRTVTGFDGEEVEREIPWHKVHEVEAESNNW